MYPPVGGSASRLDPLDKGELSLTTFTVSLPIGKKHFNEEEMIEQSESGDRSRETGKEILPKRFVKYHLPDTEGLSESTNWSPLTGLQSPVSGLRSPLMLIVEDNTDVTIYIKSLLENVSVFFRSF